MSKRSKYLSETLELECELLFDVSYGTYYCRLPLFSRLRLNNGGGAPVDALTVNFSGSTPLILPRSVELDEIPAAIADLRARSTAATGHVDKF